MMGFLCFDSVRNDFSVTYSEEVKYWSTKVKFNFTSLMHSHGELCERPMYVAARDDNFTIHCGL